MDIPKELINLNTMQLNKLIGNWSMFEVNIIENKDNQFKIILRGIKMKQLVKKNTNSEVMKILLEMKSDMARMENKIDSNFTELKKDIVDIKEDIAEIKSLPTIKKELHFLTLNKNK